MVAGGGFQCKLESQAESAGKAGLGDVHADVVKAKLCFIPVRSPIPFTFISTVIEIGYAGCALELFA